MKIELTRTQQGKTCCLGEFKVFDSLEEDAKELFSCVSLEEDKEGEASGQDLRIPEGLYKLRRHSPSRFEKTLRSITGNEKDEMINVYNNLVPSSRAILIHWGNTDKDTLGCILLGLGKNSDGESINQSRPACKKFYELMRGKDLSEVKLVIRNEFKED